MKTIIVIKLRDGRSITLDSSPQPLPELKSSKIYTIDIGGSLRDVRPYYRKTINGALTIFCEEDLGDL